MYPKGQSKGLSVVGQRMHKLSDDNYHAFKAYHNIPDDYYSFREHYPFGYAASFRRFTGDTEIIYIYGGKRYNWETLRQLLREVWRLKAWDDQAWYMNNIAV